MYNNNTSRLSSKQLFAQSVNNGTYATVQLGQPFNVRILDITATEATVLYDVIGKPRYSIIELTNVTKSQMYRFSTTTLIHKFTSLVPFNTYKVSITSIYTCDDSFTLSTPISFTTINEAPVTNFTVYLPTNQRYGFESNESSNTYLDVSFNSSIGSPIYYSIDISGISSSGNIYAADKYEHRFSNLTRNTRYTFFISTFYSNLNSTVRYISQSYDISSLTETSVSKIEVLNTKGNFVDISFTKGTSENARYIVYKNGSITDISFSYSDSIKRIDLLNPDTSYNFQLVTYYAETQNTYLSDVSINVRTANQNTITNITAIVGVFDVSFSFVASPGSNFSYTAYLLKNRNVIDSSSVNISSTTYYKNDLSMNSEYSLRFSTFYTDISYTTADFSFKTLYEGNATISGPTILGTSATINWSPFSNGAIASQPSFYSVYLDENLKTSTVGNTITLTDLTPNTNYKVNVYSTYNSSNQYRSISDISFTTLNEGPVTDVSFSLVTGNQIKIIVDTSNSFLSPTSYQLFVNDISLSISGGKNTYTFPNLTYNTLYNVTLKTSFATNVYTYETSIRTKNEHTIDLSDNDFTITGNAIIMRVNSATNTTFNNYVITCDPSSVATQVTQPISTEATIWSFHDLKPNTTHNITIIANSDVSYVSTYTKTTLNESAVGNVKGNVFNNKAVIYFSDSSGSPGSPVKYDISINPPIGTVPTILSNEIDLSNLSIDTSYSATISSHYLVNKYYKTISFRTLNQQKPTNLAIRATDTKLSIDMFIQNVADISSLRIQLLDTSINSLEIIDFSASSLPLDLVINQGHLYKGNVYCVYKDSNDSGDISYNKNNIYISDDFSFNSSLFQTTSTLTNGVFNIPNQVEEDRGFYRIPPTNWNNSLFVYAIRNELPTLQKLFYKKNPYTDVSYHAIIYRSTNSTNTGYLRQDLSGYLYSGNYVITFYVSNLFIQGLPFDNVGGVTSSNSEFQIAINSGTESIYKSGFKAVDILWNKIQLKINIAKSTTTNKFYINRTKLENNSLCISDASMTSVLSFSKETRWTSDVSWSIPDVSGKWNTVGLNSYTPVLISNMSISFWLYIHDVSFFLSKQFLFLIGDSLSIYFDSSINLFTETLSYQLSKKIPIHITIIYSNQKVSIYRNGQNLTSVSATLTEPLGSDTFSLSKTCLGYITKQFNIFDYPLSVSEILDFVQTDKIQIGNLSDISSNRISITSFASISTEETDISYQLFDTTNYLVKRLRYFSSPQQINVNTSNNLTCAFWVRTTANISLARIFDFSFCYCKISNNDLYFNEEMIFTMLPNKWYHLTWTLSNAASRFYLNGYLYKQLSTINPGNIVGFVGNTYVNMGDFKLYNLFAPESNVLTIFHSHYSLESIDPDDLTDLSTNYVYTINLNIPDGGALKNIANGNVDLSYNVKINNETFIGAFTNDASSSPISIDSITLNDYRQQASPNLTVNLSQLGISKTYSIVGPFISFSFSTINIDEGQNVTVTLNNPPAPNLFSYTISGTNIDASDFSGNDLSGNISTALTLKIRNDFKTEDPETFTFSIPSLKISKRGIITNTSNSLTFKSTSSVSKDETTEISLNVPQTATNVIFYYSISGISDEDILINGASINSTNKIFTYNQSNIIIKVATPLSKTLLLTLTEYEHIFKKIRLNDVAKASLNLFDLVRSYFYEGETIKININVPFSKLKDFEYRYVITGTIASSDLSGVEMSGNIKVEGEGATATFQIPIKNDFRTEGSETLIFSLYDENADVPDASLNFDILDSSIASSYTLSSDKTTVNEGESFTIYLNTTGVPPNVDVSYIISGVESSDISFVPLSGRFTTTASGVVSNTFFISNDSLTDGNDTFKIALIGLGANVYTEVTIIDKSLKPTYTFFASPANYILDEKPLSLWLQTNNAVPKNTIIPYTITGISSEDISGVTLQGNILTTQISNENSLTIQRVTTEYKTMLISAYDISSVKIGLNYSTSNPKSTIVVTRDSRDSSFVYINSTWYGYNNQISFSISGDVSGSFTGDEFEQSKQQRTTATSGTYRFYQENNNSPIDICYGSYRFS